MVSFHRTLSFRHTVLFLCLFVVLEALIFGALYESTFAIYEHRTNSEIEAEARDLAARSARMTVTEFAGLIKRLSQDEPGQQEEYIFAGRRYEYIEGNIRQWPQDLPEGAQRADLSLGRPGARHRLQQVPLPNGYRLLVGRQLTELDKIRLLIVRALKWTFALTILLGLGGGFLLSRIVSGRLEMMNRGSLAILEGDISRRMPIMGTGDEYDALAVNLNRMLDRIEKLMNGLREVTDNVAHDLRKPISRVRSRIELTLMGPPDPEIYRETLTGVVEEIDRILNVFGALLTIAGAEAGASRSRFVSVDLARVAESTAEIYEPVAEEAGLAIQVQCEKSVTVKGDPDLIAQAVANLVDNAVKYAPGSGPLSIRVSRQGALAAITVADRGPGIPEESRGQVLKRFVRLDPSRTTEGSGLGLSVVHAVAVLHAGRIVLGDGAPGLRASLEIPIASGGADPRKTQS